MTRLIGGPVLMGSTQDECGYREYRVGFLVQSDNTDGPANVLQTPGLPAYGSFWGYRNDLDAFAWCRWDSHVKSRVPDPGQGGLWWDVEKVFSTKPADPRACGCRDQPFQDPLLEPPKVGGGFVKKTEQASVDRWGGPITSSSFEPLRGAAVEFDRSSSQVTVEMNVPDLRLDVVTPMVDCVNLYPLWGMPPRCVKLSEFRWSREFWGACAYYYKWSLGFDVRAGGFDRDVIDESNYMRFGDWQQSGTTWQYACKALSAPPGLTAADVGVAKDRHGENARFVLDGRGRPANTPLADPNDPYVSSPGSGLDKGLPPAFVRIEKYASADFSVLGIPLIV